jgi:hypothetical protein
MSFEAAIASAGGNDAILAKSFNIAAEGNALAWYSMLRPSLVYSWEDLRSKIIANFKGFTSESLTSMDMFHCRQNQGEALKDYFQRFVQLKVSAAKSDRARPAHSKPKETVWSKSRALSGLKRTQDRLIRTCGVPVNLMLQLIRRER